MKEIKVSSFEKCPFRYYEDIEEFSHYCLLDIPGFRHGCCCCYVDPENRKGECPLRDGGPVTVTWEGDDDDDDDDV